MNKSYNAISFLVTLVSLFQVAPTWACDTITFPFFTRGVVVSQSPGPDGTINIIAEGKATQLGRYKANVVLKIIPGQPPTFKGVITMFAANGDELHLVNFGVVTDPLPNPGGEGMYEITGGTGRFAGANGRGLFSSHEGTTPFMGTITHERMN